jgi:hypothetical protein
MQPDRFFNLYKLKWRGFVGGSKAVGYTEEGELGIEMEFMVLKAIVFLSLCESILLFLYVDPY